MSGLPPARIALAETGHVWRPLICPPWVVNFALVSLTRELPDLTWSRVVGPGSWRPPPVVRQNTSTQSTSTLQLLSTVHAPFTSLEVPVTVMGTVPHWTSTVHRSVTFWPTASVLSNGVPSGTVTQSVGFCSEAVPL